MSATLQGVRVNGKIAGHDADVVIVLPHGWTWEKTSKVEQFVLGTLGMSTISTWVDGTGTCVISGYKEVAAL